MPKTLALAVAFLVAVISVLAGCGSRDSGEGASSGADVVEVVATTPQVADFARNVGGESVEVHDVIRPGVDPHDYEPSAADIEKLSRADLIVRNGAGYEEWFEPTIDSASPSGKVVDASAGIALRTTNGAPDPHIWQNPQNAKVMATNIAAALKSASPAIAADVDRRVAQYTAQLDDLDREIAGRMDGLADKKIVTDHDALGYYIDRYGLTLVGTVAPSFDTNAELSSAQINDLVAKIRTANAKAIFVEQAVPAKSADTIARESGAKVVSGEDALYADTFGESAETDSYIDVMRHNTNSITTALG